MSWSGSSDGWPRAFDLAGITNTVGTGVSNQRFFDCSSRTPASVIVRNEVGGSVFPFASAVSLMQTLRYSRS
jgi:hypothetical protein